MTATCGCSGSPIRRRVTNSTASSPAGRCACNASDRRRCRRSSPRLLSISLPTGAMRRARAGLTSSTSTWALRHGDKRRTRASRCSIASRSSASRFAWAKGASVRLGFRAAPARPCCWRSPSNSPRTRLRARSRWRLSRSSITTTLGWPWRSWILGPTRRSCCAPAAALGRVWPERPGTRPTWPLVCSKTPSGWSCPSSELRSASCLSGLSTGRGRGRTPMRRPW